MDFDIKKKAAFAGAPELQKKADVASDPQKKDFADFKSTFYTNEEQDKLLIGYDPVPADALLLVRSGTHVRYLTTAGDFRRGGFVHNVKSKGKPMIFLETGKDAAAPGYAKWPVAQEDIAMMWKKRTLEDVKINNVQAAERENPRTLELERRVVALETHVEHVVSEIQKLVTAVLRVNEKIQVNQPMVATMRPAALRRQ